MGIHILSFLSRGRRPRDVIAGFRPRTTGYFPFGESNQSHSPGSLRRAKDARSPARLASAGRSPNSPGAYHAPRARSKGSRRLPALLGARRATRGEKKTSSELGAARCSTPPTWRPMLVETGTRGFSIPVARAEYRRPTGSIQASPCSSRAAYFAADELASAWWGEERRRMSRAPGRAFFGFFLCTSKDKFDGIEFVPPKAARRARAMEGPRTRNPPAVRGTVITTRPQAARS